MWVDTRQETERGGSLGEITVETWATSVGSVEIVPPPSAIVLLNEGVGRPSHNWEGASGRLIVAMDAATRG